MRDNAHVAMKPDWFMTGITTPEGVMVMASDTLREADLRLLYMDSADDFTHHRFIAPEGPRGYRLAVKCDTVFIAQGDDYAEAIRVLFGMWQPKDAERREIAPPVRALGR